MKNDNGKSAATYYVVYSTSVSCSDDPENNGIDAELRVFCPQSAPLFADGTVVYAYAKMFAPPNQPILLDAIRTHPFPGDPGSEDYDNHIPQNVASAVIVHGSVTAAPSRSADGSRTFPITVSEYVRDVIRQSHIQYVFILLLLMRL
jgi:hypothetical protein